MTLSTGEKWVLGLAGFGLLGLVAVAAASQYDDDSADDIDEDDLPPGRALELSMLGELDRQYGSRRVLDNPTLLTQDGGLMRPDGVAVDDHGDALEVREAKDVAQLRREHVYQAAYYDQQLEPRYGTTLDVPERAFIGEGVLALAQALGIAIETWTDDE